MVGSRCLLLALRQKSKAAAGARRLLRLPGDLQAAGAQGDRGGRIARDGAAGELSFHLDGWTAGAREHLLSQAPPHRPPWPLSRVIKGCAAVGTTGRSRGTWTNRFAAAMPGKLEIVQAILRGSPPRLRSPQRLAAGSRKDRRNAAPEF